MALSDRLRDVRDAGRESFEALSLLRGVIQEIEETPLREVVPPVNPPVPSTPVIVGPTGQPLREQLRLGVGATVGTGGGGGGGGRGGFQRVDESGGVVASISTGGGGGGGGSFAPPAPFGAALASDRAQRTLETIAGELVALRRTAERNDHGADLRFRGLG